MAIENKMVRTTDISRKKDLLSTLDDLAPLPAPYDKNGLEPAFKEPKPEWAETNCCSLDGFCAIDTMKRPATKEEEDELKAKFLKGLEKLFLDANNKYLQPLSLTMEYCAKCNTCSEACHVFQATDGDEIYRPIFRVDILRKLYKKYFTPSGKLLGSFTGADIDLDWETIARLGELSYRCNLCRRCAQVCPMGLDNGMMAREIRKIFSMEMGLAPTPVHTKGTQLQLKVGSTTGLTKPAFIDALEFIEEDIEERTGRKIKFPLDKKGADVLLVHNAGEFLAWPENPAAFAILLDEAGVDWTLSTDMMGFDSVNYGIWYDDVQAKNVAMAQFEVAKKLGAKRIVIGECGHAHKAAVVGADRMADSDQRGVPVESFLPMMAEFVKTGRLKFDPSKNDFPVTLHDPCNMVRQMGIVKPQRDILHKIAPQFREMTPHGVDNYCCGGGSGFAIMNSYNFGDFRNKVSARIKFAQILNAFEDEIENPDIVKYVCAPCSNCKGTIRDLLQTYKATARYNVQYGGIVELMVNGLASMDRPYFEFLEAE
ncbi:4Fe-4S ferredoxin [Gordonibacter sp. 28C]|uniref:(Fe-S)-binding protein n=1 Tax=Gordonibacter sp. 28C TaxID=2078569 RepID=UPI000DF7AE4A|nr:(Fe-S)-binding protein [Gordonibacter sp. 28C]RDB61490.1 4Fe-4S ferredoxin [Gordonibacter sp. 28C]